MAKPQKRVVTILAIFLCMFMVVGTVSADGYIHPDFDVSSYISGGKGYASTWVINGPLPDHRPQVKCELQNSITGAAISTNANYGGYNVRTASTSCQNPTGITTLRLWTTHMQWINATEYVFYDTRP